MQAVMTILVILHSEWSCLIEDNFRFLKLSNALDIKVPFLYTIYRGTYDAI